MDKATGARFDQLEERLFGEARVDPGILVRMDERLDRLEGNPAIVLGNMAKGIVAGCVTLGAIFYTFANLDAVIQFIHHLRGK